MIETTGLADPAPVVQSFFVDERIKHEYQLNGVVTVVDAKHIFQQLGNSPEAKEQIAFADMVLLNKTDLINPEDLPELEFKLRNLNGAARVCQTRNSDVDIATVLDLRSLDIEVRAEKHDHNHRHTEDIETVAISTAGDLDGLKLSHWFRELLAEFGERIMRMKGIFNLRKDPDQFVFQGVHMLFEGRPGRAWADDEDVSIAWFSSAVIWIKRKSLRVLSTASRPETAPRLRTKSTPSAASKMSPILPSTRSATGCKRS